jgi:hypothetical protein
MALFKKGATAAAASQSDVAKLRARKADLDRQLGEAKAAAATRQQDLEQMLISGSDESAIEKAETHLADTERRARALAAAISKISEQITQKEAEIAAAEDRKRREQAVALLEADVRELEPAAVALAAAAKTFAEAAEKLGVVIFEARGLVNLGQNLAAEIPSAAERVATFARSHARQVLDGHAPVPAEPEVVAAPVVAKPLVPTKPIFLIKAVHWQDPENPAFQQTRPSHSQVALPFEFAKRAIERNAAIEVNDPRVAVLAKTNSPKFMPKDQSVSLDENPVEIDSTEPIDESPVIRSSHLEDARARV